MLVIFPLGDMFVGIKQGGEEGQASTEMARDRSYERWRRQRPLECE